MRSGLRTAHRTAGAWRERLSHGALIVVAFAGFGCSSPRAMVATGAATAPTSSVSQISSVVVSVPYSSIVVGDTERLQAIATFADGTQRDVTQQATWQSSDSTGATVSSAGTVLGIRAGSVQITATYQASSATRQVVVLGISRLTIAAPGGQFHVGDAVQLSASATLSDNTSLDVTGTASWQTSASTVASVSTSGLLTVTGFGAADVSATYRGVRSVSQVTVPTPAPTPTPPTPAPTVCTYALSGVSFSDTYGTYVHVRDLDETAALRVIAPAGCAWTVSVSAPAPWFSVYISPNGPSALTGTGTAYVGFSLPFDLRGVPPNIKTIVVTVAGQLVTVQWN